MENLKENILNYGDSIISMASFRDAVRHNPGMYIGGGGNLGFVNMTREIFSNAIDELTKPTSICNWVKLTFDERDFKVIVEDNGRGIPFNKMIDIFTREHTSSNYRKQDYEYSSGVHGIGSKVTCALSGLFAVKSHILGECKYVEFHDGYLWDKGDIIDIDKSEMDREQGTTVTFVPYTDLKNQLSVKCEDIRNLVTTILLLTPIGSIIDFVGIDNSGNLKYNERFVNERGLQDKLDSFNKNKITNNIYSFMDNGKVRLETVINFAIEEEPVVLSFSNLTPTKGGVHEDGFYNGAVKFFRNYMNKIYLGEKSKVFVNSNDVKDILSGVIHICTLKPNFMGQAKDLLAEPAEGDFSILNFVSDFTESSLADWAKQNPKELAKVAKFLKTIAENRMKSEGAVKKLSNQYKKSSISGLPQDYIKPSGRKNLELLIVEGKSALSSVTNARNCATQGIYPIRGKLPNAFEKSPQEMLKNSEVASIIEIVGGGYGKNFNLNSVRFDKVIFLTDPDPDGAHISGLLLNLFAVYMKPMIEDGRVYKAVPPLYGMHIGKNKMRYFTDKAEQTRYVQKLFAKENIVSVDGSPLSNNKLFDIMYRNSEYVFELEKLSNNYAVPAILMEAVLIGQIKNTPIKKIHEHLKKKYFRFLNFTQINGIDTINGLAGNAVELIITEELYKDAKIVLEILNENLDFYFKLNDNDATLYELMKTYKSYEPSSLQRYKGLGEMESYQLKDSTLDIENRTLIRYTPESLDFEINQMRTLSDNRYDLLKDIRVKRSDLI
mgnify:CR=1 FL=1